MTNTTTPARADQDRTVTGVITSIRRLKSSRYGNPRFSVTIGGRDYKTAPNVMLAYGIENPEYREQEHVFELNGQGNIVSARPAGDS